MSKVGGEELVRGRIPDHHLDRSFQFFSVIPIASSPKGTQEVMGMSLQKRGAGSHHFSSLASLLPWSRHLIETTMGCGKRWEVGERTLASSLPGPIDIHHHILLVDTIPQ